MADRTAQPPTGVGANSIYSSVRFIWNAIDANVNQNTGATGTGVKGTSVAAVPGTYRLFDNTNGAITFSSITVPTGAYTLVLVGAYPAANKNAAGRIFNTPGGGIRNEGTTTASAVNQQMIHSGVGAPAQVSKADGFDDDIWTFVVRYDGTTVVQDLRAPGGTTTSASGALGYSVGSAASIELGSAAGVVCMGGLYAVLYTGADVGSTEATAIMDNSWRIFAPEADGSAAPRPGPIRSFASVRASRY